MNAYHLPRTEVHQVSAPNGRQYRICIAFPESPAPPDGFPVVYLLDANALFGSMVEAVRMRAHRPVATGVPPSVVVGIGYSTEGLYDRVARTYDYTPTPAAGEPDAGDASLETGGAGAFLTFLESQVMQKVQCRTPIDRSRQVLFGHSLAGYFVLHTLLQRPDLFMTFIASSPSIWWNPNLLFDGATQGAFSHSKPRVVMAVGEYEERLAPWQQEGPASEMIAERRARRAMVVNAREVASRLSAAGAAVDYQEFAGEDHASVPLLAINRGLRYAFALNANTTPRPQQRLDTRSSDAI